MIDVESANSMYSYFERELGLDLSTKHKEMTLAKRQKANYPIPKARKFVPKPKNLLNDNSPKKIKKEKRDIAFCFSDLKLKTENLFEQEENKNKEFDNAVLKVKQDLEHFVNNSENRKLFGASQKSEHNESETFDEVPSRSSPNQFSTNQREKEDSPFFDESILDSILDRVVDSCQDEDFFSDLSTEESLSHFLARM